MSTPTLTTTTANNVAAIVEQYPYAEAHLHRRRQTLCGPSLTDREALRLIYANADTDQACTPRAVATDLRNHRRVRDRAPRPTPTWAELDFHPVADRLLRRVVARLSDVGCSYR